MPAALVFHWLALASEKLLLPCLGLDLTASVAHWCALARPDSGNPSSDSASHQHSLGLPFASP